MMHCAVCGLHLHFYPPELFTCPTGHFALRVVLTPEEHTTYSSNQPTDTTSSSSALSFTGDHNAVGWGELPTRTPVHPWYHDAFWDVEMLEP